MMLMDFNEIVRKRRMVRNFTDAPVDEAAIARILETAQRGPSAGFTQGQDFVVVRKPETKNKIAEICHEHLYAHPFVSGAPVLIVPCTSESAYHKRYQEADKTKDDGTEIDWPVPYWFMDAGCAVMLLLMAVVDEGLSAGFAGAMNLDDLRAVLNMPAEVTPVGVIPIGHPAPDKRSPSLKRGRRSTNDFIHQETW